MLSNINILFYQDLEKILQNCFDVSYVIYCDMLLEFDFH